MKNILIACLACFLFTFIACDRGDDGLVKEQEISQVGQTEKITRSSSRSTPSCDDLSISYELIYQDASCCNYQFNLKALKGDGDIPVQVKLNGIDYENHLVKESETFFLTLCPSPDVLVEIYVGEELCFSEALNCKCEGCGKVNISSDFIRREGDCCIYSINFSPVCPGTNALLDYYVDRTLTQNLNITSNSSIRVEVCDGESKDIQILSGREVCFSEVFDCIDCCEALEYTIDGVHQGGDCCEFIFTFDAPQECLDSYTTAFGWTPTNSGIVNSQFIGNTISVTKCDPATAIYFIVFDENDNICYRSSNYQYCQD